MISIPECLEVVLQSNGFVHVSFPAETDILESSAYLFLPSFFVFKLSRLCLNNGHTVPLINIFKIRLWTNIVQLFLL